MTSADTGFEHCCGSFKWGEYNPLRCCREKGHEGEHNYVVSGPAYSDDVENDDDGPAVDESEHDAETEAEDAR